MSRQPFTGISLPDAPNHTEVWARPLRTASVEGAIPRAAQIPPFWQFKPPQGKDLYAKVRGTLAAGVGSTLRLTPTIPWAVLPGYKGVLQTFTITVLAPLATLNVVFTLLNQNSPVPGWDAFVPDQVAANAIILPFIGPLQLSERSTLAALITNNSAAGPWNVEVAFAGWQWPRILEQQTFGTDQG